MDKEVNAGTVAISTQVVSELGKRKIVSILRGSLNDREIDIAQTMLMSGITVLEITLNSPNALQNIKSIRNKLGDSIIVGAGTVLRDEEVRAAHDAGAKFIVSPNCSPSVIRTAKERGMASFPGCSTCTEMLNAMDQGADAVKVFPATMVKPDGIRAILASVGHLRLIPTGGVTVTNAADYMQAGAWALGVGAALLDKKSVDDLNELRARCEGFVASVASQG